MSSVAVLSARYLFEKLKNRYQTLPIDVSNSPRMHEFILTLSDDDFSNLENHGIPKNQAIPQIGKLFLDFGFHAPTVAFPEVFGLMIEPTESYTKKNSTVLWKLSSLSKTSLKRHPMFSRLHHTSRQLIGLMRFQLIEISAYMRTLNRLPPLPHNRISLRTYETRCQ